MHDTFKMTNNAKQMLPPEAYTSEAWFARENAELFSRTWSFAGAASQLANKGDYLTAQVGKFNLLVIRDDQGRLRAFHNLCRHRGTELVDRGCGNTGGSIVCPYHRWTFGLDGALRGVPNQKTCFPDLDKAALGLHPASVGVYAGLVFVNPEPDQTLDDWLGSIRQVPWPHDLDSPELQAFDQVVTYEMQCNWKVFFENAIDGYHLAYLHQNTLGGPTPDKNIWDAHGLHQVWYSTEDEHVRSRTPNFVTQRYDRWQAERIPHAANHGYGGVYMLFPTTLIVATPWSFSVSWMEPKSADVTLLHARVWAAPSWTQFRGSVADIPGYDPDSGMIKSSHWTQHPLETNDFQTEDIYVVEKMQRALASPRYQIGALAQGAGAEAPLTYFQNCVRSFLPTVG